MLKKFEVRFKDSWGNNISLVSGVADNTLHLSCTDNKEPTMAYLSHEDVNRLIKELQNYQKERILLSEEE